MGPDNFLRRDANGRPLPAKPQRSIEDFGPRRPQQAPNQQPPARHSPQKPMQDFGPRPAGPRAMEGFGAPNSAPRPQYPHHTQHHQHATADQHTPAPFKEEPKTKEKRKFSKLDKILLAVLAVIIVGAFVVPAILKKNPHKKVVPTAHTVPLVQPDFTVYYPQTMPDGVSTAKGSVTYSKNSFTFILEQDGQKSYFVYEQPATTDPGFNTLKGSLSAPHAISLSIGPGIMGGLGTGTAIGVTTDKGTSIIINCTKAVCSTTPQDILSNMQVTTDLANLRRGSS